MALSKVYFVLLLISLAAIFTSVKAGWRVKACLSSCSVKFYDDSLNYVGGYSDADLINYASSRRSGGYGSSGYGYYYPSYNYNNGYNNGYYNNYYGNGYGNYYGNGYGNYYSNGYGNYYGNGYGNNYGTGYSNSGNSYSNYYNPYNYGSYYNYNSGK